ncbi:MAG: addiction module antidote protein [Sphingopyxis sp.]|nr:addiction module antidote protein [Sphingopyxis sp.]
MTRAFRIAGFASGTEHDPQPQLIALLGDAHAVSCFRLLIAGMAHVWPDPLSVFRPCCPCLTHDEASLLAMVTHAGRNDRRAFDRAIGEMIGEDGRDWLFATSARLAAALAA